MFLQSRSLLLLMLCLFLSSLVLQAQSSGTTNEVISSDNADEITQLARIGDGQLVGSTMTEDGRLFIVTSSSGIRIYDLDQLEAEPVLLGQRERIYAPMTDNLVTPDSENFLTSGPDGRLEIWHLGTFELVHSNEVKGDSLNRIVLSADGKMVATASGAQLSTMMGQESAPDEPTNFIQLWDVRDGNLIREFDPQDYYISDLAFSPDASLIAASSWDGNVYVWDVSTADLVQTLSHDSNVNGIQFAPDSSFLIANSNNAVVVWDMPDASERFRLENVSFGFGNVYIDDSNRITAHVAGEVMVWDLTTGEEIYQFGAFDENETLGFVHLPDDILRVFYFDSSRDYDLATGEEIAREVLFDLNETTSFDNVAGIEIISGVEHYESTSGLYEFVSSIIFTSTQTIQQHFVLQQGETILLDFELGSINSPSDRISYAPDDSSLLLSDSQAAYIIDLQSFDEIARFTPDFRSGQRFVTASYAPDGTAYSLLEVSGSSTPALQMLNIITGDVVHEIAIPEGLSPVWDLTTFMTIDDTGTEALLYGRGGAVYRWNFDTMTFVEINEKHGEFTLTRDITPDQTRLVAITPAGETIIWDSITGEVIDTLPTESGACRAVAISDDGMLIAVADSGALQIWDIEVDVPRFTIQAYENECMRQLAFTADASVVITTGGTFYEGDTAIKLWNVETGDLLYTLDGHSGAVNAIAFNTEGTQFATVAWDNTLRIWGIPTE